MSKRFDCFFVGQNQIGFKEYVKTIEKMGTHSGAYLDLSKNFVKYNENEYSASDIFNLFSPKDNMVSYKPIKRVEVFNAAIAYLGTYLKRREFSFDFVNSFQDEKEYFAEKLIKENILTIAIITTLYITPLPIIEIVKFIRNYNQKVKIVVGGPFVATKIRTLNKKEINYIFKLIGADFYIDSHQGEETLVNIIYYLKNNLSLSNIKNIYFKNEKDEYEFTSTSRENNKLSKNTVDWSLFSDRVGEFVNIRTSISCPFSCSFCGFPEHEGDYQVIDVELIEKELNQLNEIKSIKLIHFIDDTFNVPLKRFKEILKMMIKNNYTFKWHSYFRCQYADRETVELMKESGCLGVFLGLESGNQQILRNMNKIAAKEEYLRGIDLLKEFGILTLGNFIIGFPGETFETVQETIEFIQKSGIDLYRAQLWYCEPITPIWRDREKYKLEGNSFEWLHATMDSRIASTEIEKMILSIEYPVRLPQYYFDFDNVFQLNYKGMNFEHTNKFLKSFDEGVKLKLKYPTRKEINVNIIDQIVRSFNSNNKEKNKMEKKDLTKKYKLKFNL